MYRVGRRWGQVSPRDDASGARTWRGHAGCNRVGAMGEGSRLGTGDRIGDYRIELVLNRGELWDLAAAAHMLLPRLAAIRVAQAGPSEAGVRLLREACILEALTHPGVPRLYECGRLADRRPWVATERVIGRLLAEELADGAMAPARVAAVVRDVAAVLEHAHRRGIVHGAIRAETILVTDAAERGWPVCVCDWSDARTDDAAIDVHALAVVASAALAGTHAPDRLAWLLDDMLTPDPGLRPSAAAVREAATQLVTDLEAEQADRTAMAMAMMAIEEVALAELADDHAEVEAEVEIEITVARGSSTNLDSAAGAAVGGGRLRKPRWTPSGIKLSSDHAKLVSGEIDRADPED